MIDNKDVEKTLKACKLKIEKAKEDLAEAKAQKKVLLSTLKKDFSLDNFVEAEQTIKKLTKELELLSSSIETKYNELKDKFGLI